MQFVFLASFVTAAITQPDIIFWSKIIFESFPADHTPTPYIPPLATYPKGF